LTFAEASAALVYDQSTFGPTSPITGQRYRFEVAPSVGSLRFTSVTLDYRRYVPVVRPVTLAVRAMHLARFGGGAEDPRLSELFLGYPALVRVYDAGSFDAVNDCDATTLTCPEFDALFGSRLLLANAELRFPLLGVWTGRYHYGPIPIEGFLFSDAGVAWTSTIRPSFAGGVRDVVRSAGAA
jgi:outer membrane protein assembly factor BamA